MTRSHPAALLLPLILLTGCFSSGAVEEHFYALAGPTSALEKGQGPRLVVMDLAAAAGYDTQRLAYRVSDHEIRYYAYRQWVADPSRMLTEMVIRHLRSSGRFSQVARAEKIRDPDAILEGTVDAIEEVDVEDGWRARLAMTFHLRHSESDRVVLRHAFDVVMPCAKRHPDEVAKTISSILTRETERLGRRISQALGK